MTVVGPVRVVVVEDSLVQRAHLVRTLEADGDITVVGEAEDARQAIEMVERLRPDVVTLDLIIPAGGGQRAIEEIMGETPTPILVLSGTVANRASASAVEALVAGAMDALPKPSRWTPDDEAALRHSVRTLRGAVALRHSRGRMERLRVRATSSKHDGRSTGAGPVVALVASTGGPPALAEVLAGLGPVRAPVLVVQHLHPHFVDGLATWMAKASGRPVEIAESGRVIQPGTVYIGPGGTHLRLGPDRRIVLCSTPVTLHRPSADELFASVAEHAGSEGIGVILTGIGNDGSAGLLALRNAGGVTIAQDEATSAVFGMPNAAQRVGAVMQVLPLERIAAAIGRAERSVHR